MGCGQSTDSAFSNRGSISSLKPYPQQSSVEDSGAAHGNGVGPEPVVDRETVEEYLQTEREIGEARRADPQVLSQLEMKTEALDKMTQKVERLEREYGDLQALAKDGDQSDTKKALVAIKRGARASTAEEERVAGCNNKEIAKQARDEAVRQKENIQKEVDQLQSKAARLQNLYTKQDALLSKIFGGEYGSDLENKLEEELDALEAQKARIMEANFKEAGGSENR
ncbi:uncharacterized protein LOC119109891 [Pollicipes pollicipes]|uniref:uncharacterized protein LOC119109891 n=1 Tax=Pollicipes pollicipes TaxID=41117 RepID=UPI001884F07A|nr:uncharacterized protein LOC119109891 [Pollicipes pollicipes]